MVKEPVYCIGCSRWASIVKDLDLCYLDGKRLAREKSSTLGMHLYSRNTGNPSRLNVDHNCIHYKQAGILLKLGRRIFFGVPLKPYLISKLEN